MSDDYDTTEKIEETETGYRLTIRSSRGTGVRDEDSVNVEANYETVDKLEEESEELRSVVVERLNELRENQPDEEDGGSDE